jgi:hypothetical protein
MQGKGIAVLFSIVLLANPAMGQDEERSMSFFVTSVGMGNGADLGGLAGADKHCQKLSTAAGAGDRTWRAYLSTEEPDKRGVFARPLILAPRNRTNVVYLRATE